MSSVIFDVTEAGLIKRRLAMLAAPVLPLDQFIGLAHEIGLCAPDWDHGSGSYRTKRASRVGYIYFGRLPSDVVKVGFSARPSERVAVLQMELLALVCYARLSHERLLQWLLREECVSREYFRGPKLNALILGIAAKSAVRFGEFDEADRERWWLEERRRHSPHRPQEAKQFPNPKAA